MKISNELLELAYISGNHSRFKIDPGFTEEEFRSLYKQWVINTLNGKYGDHIFGYYEENNLQGMVSIDSNIPDAKGNIGLIAVNEHHQGQQIGSKMLSFVENWCTDHSINKLFVTTQRTNLKACRFYEMNDYAVSSINNIYHFWI